MSAQRQDSGPSEARPAEEPMDSGDTSSSGAAGALEDLNRLDVALAESSSDESGLDLESRDAIHARVFYGSLIEKSLRKWAQSSKSQPETSKEAGSDIDRISALDSMVIIDSPETQSVDTLMSKVASRIIMDDIEAGARACKGGFSDWFMTDCCRRIAPDPGSIPAGPFAKHPRLPSPPIISFEKCSKCHKDFSYSLGNSTDPVTIIRGIPDAEKKYKAISYVWGETEFRDIPCVSCGNITEVPLKGADTLHRLLCPAGPGSSVWLDCVSINQSDPADVARIIPSMGKIYERADVVSVILPETDYRAFTNLDQLVRVGWVMLQSREHFAHNRDEVVRGMGKTQPLSQFCEMFFATLEAFRDEFGDFAYFQRAWTFQEWALARDLEIGCEKNGTEQVKFYAF